MAHITLNGERLDIFLQDEEHDNAILSHCFFNICTCSSSQGNYARKKKLKSMQFGKEKVILSQFAKT